MKFGENKMMFSYLNIRFCAKLKRKWKSREIRANEILCFFLNIHTINTFSNIHTINTLNSVVCDQVFVN